MGRFASRRLEHKPILQVKTYIKVWLMFKSQNILQLRTFALKFSSQQIFLTIFAAVRYRNELPNSLISEVMVHVYRG